jgi:hypothetical protein
VKSLSFIRALSSLGIFLSVSVVAGLAAIPGLYILLWAFRSFLVDAVFTGKTPGPADMAAFCLFFGAALCFFVLSSAFTLAAGCRFLRPLRRGTGIRAAAGHLLDNVFLRLVPTPGARDFFRRLSGRE